MPTKKIEDNVRPEEASISNMKVVNEQQEENQMIKEIDEDEAGHVAMSEAVTPDEIMHLAGEILADGPLHTHQDDGEEEKRDVVKMITDDSVLSSQNQGILQPTQQEMPSDDDLETFRIVFELFDRDRSGFIDNHDLAAIAVKLGKDPSERKLFRSLLDCYLTQYCSLQFLH